MTSIFRSISLAISLIALASSAFAQQVPNTINFQSVLRDDSGNLITDNFIDMQVQVLDQAGNLLYSETQPGALVVRGAVNIMIGEGVLPGSNTPTGGLPLDVLDPVTGAKFLQVQYGGNTPIGPIAIGSVPYAMFAEQALTLDPNITELNIPDIFATQSELDAAILAEEQARIAGDANDLTTSTTFGGDVTGTYNNLQLGTGVVGSNELADASITGADIANGSIDPIKLAPNSITSSQTNDDNFRINGLFPYAFGTVNPNSSANSCDVTNASGNVSTTATYLGGSRCRVIITGTSCSGGFVVIASRSSFENDAADNTPTIYNKSNSTCNFSIGTGYNNEPADFVMFRRP